MFATLVASFAFLGAGMNLNAVLLGALFQTLSLDFSTMIGQAFGIINALWPIFILPLGFTLGLGLLGWIMREIGKSIKP
jgi:hypothetical protein